MSTASVLDKLKDYLQEMVVSKIELQKASDDNIMHYELVHPSVFVGWIPPKGYLPNNIESNIPCIIVGLDNGEDNAENSDFDIRLSFAVFSPGEHITTDGGNVTYAPSFKGYNDLLNLIDLTKATLISDTIIKRQMKLQGAIKWGMYEEQPYPYWYGHMRFTVSTKAYPKTNIERLL